MKIPQWALFPCVLPEKVKFFKKLLTVLEKTLKAPFQYVLISKLTFLSKSN